MPKICSAGGCANHHLQTEKGLSFYKRPSKEKYPEKRALVRACNRQNVDGSEWTPTASYIYMCSAHFISGKLSNLFANCSHNIVVCHEKSFDFYVTELCKITHIRWVLVFGYCQN